MVVYRTGLQYVENFYFIHYERGIDQHGLHDSTISNNPSRINPSIDEVRKLKAPRNGRTNVLVTNYTMSRIKKSLNLIHHAGNVHIHSPHPA